jgi:hypothetical protein
MKQTTGNLGPIALFPSQGLDQELLNVKEF